MITIRNLKFAQQQRALDRDRHRYHARKIHGMNKRMRWRPKKSTLKRLNSLGTTAYGNVNDCLGTGRMRREFLFVGMIVLLMMFASSAQLALVGAQNSSVGVQIGNYFEYSVSLSGSNASSSKAYGLTITNLTVTNVTGTLVTASVEAQFQNGTNRNVTASEDVETGESENSANVPIPWTLVAANLTVDEPTYPNSSSWANETVTMNGRPTDNAIQTNLTQGGEENDTLDLYWDVATGVPVNVSAIRTVTGQGVTINLTYVLIATNAWTTAVPEFSPGVMVTIMTTLAGVAGATALIRKKRADGVRLN